MVKRNITSKIITLVGAIFIFGLFYKISKWTPLAGDDWGYALNGMTHNPFLLVLDFYKNWSGRMVSEFWGFVVAPRKGLWNILNSCFFTLIYLFVVKIVHIRKSNILTGLIVLVLMLNVSNQLRMETYTWIMGTTYVIPLLLSLIILYTSEKCYVLKECKGKEGLVCAVLCILCFLCGLTLENIAAVMVFALILICGHLFFYEKKIPVHSLINAFFSLVGFLIMRSSPGSASRLVRDNPEWVKLSLFEQIRIQYPTFIRFTFLDCKYIILLLAIVVGIYCLRDVLNSKSKLKWFYLIINILIQGLAVVSAFANVLENKIPLDIFEMMVNEYSMYSIVFWSIYIVNLIATLYYVIPNTYIKEKALFYVLLAGSSTLIMMVSPVFGARCSLYFVYFAIVLIGILFNELQIENKYIIASIALVCCLLIYRKSNEYIMKYSKVNQVYQKRLSDIAYYIDHPEIKDVYITRMPPLTVHGADVEVGDDYHFEVFKKYYGLSEDNNIIFVWAESY